MEARCAVCGQKPCPHNHDQRSADQRRRDEAAATQRPKEHVIPAGIGYWECAVSGCKSPKENGEAYCKAHELTKAPAPWTARTDAVPEARPEKPLDGGQVENKRPASTVRNPPIEELSVLAYAAMLKAYHWRSMTLVKEDGTFLRGIYIDGFEPMTMYVVRGARFER